MPIKILEGKEKVARNLISPFRRVSRAPWLVSRNDSFSTFKSEGELDTGRGAGLEAGMNRL